MKPVIIPAPALAEGMDPLSDEERGKIEKLLGPEIIREILTTHEEYEAQRLSTHHDLRLHWLFGKLKRADWTVVQATTFNIR